MGSPSPREKRLDVTVGATRPLQRISFVRQHATRVGTIRGSEEAPITHPLTVLKEQPAKHRRSRVKSIG